MEEKIKDLFISAFSLEMKICSKEADKEKKREYVNQLSCVLQQINHIKPNEHVQNALRKLWSFDPGHNHLEDIKEDIKKAIKILLPKQ